MGIWTETKKAEVYRSYRRSTLRAHEFLAAARMMAAGRAAQDLESLLTDYVQGIYSLQDHLGYEVREVIDQVGVRAGLLSQGGSFFDRSLGVKREVLSAFCPHLVPAIYPM